MNIVPARAAVTDGSLEIVAGSLHAFVSGNVGFRPNGLRALSLGIRPEQFEDRPVAVGSGGLDGIVRIVEPLGSDLFVTIELEGGDRVTARLRPDAQTRVGEYIGLGASLRGAHLFDSETENRVWTIEGGVENHYFSLEASSYAS
jgi:ABC-type sugar transport system ATPase subunit